MALDGIDLLLVRPEDLVVALVRLDGFDLDGETLTAGAGGGHLVLTLPPQATAETTYDVATAASRGRVSGPSRLTLLVPAGSSAPFTASGVLGLASLGGPLPSTNADLSGPISLEIPWGLRLGVRGAGDASIVTALPTTPLLGRTGAAGLWHLRLEAADGLALVPLEVLPDDPAAVPVLNQQQRDRIFLESHGAAPPVFPSTPHMDLSALGGSVSAAGRWPTFAWEHETVLGRDVRVRTEAQGFLYPWGHRATLIQVVTRDLVPEAGGVAAGLQDLTVLVVPDPVRRPGSSASLTRALPFDEVEVLQPLTVVAPPGLAANVAVTERWESKRAKSDRELELQETIAGRDARESSVPEMFHQLRADIEAGGIAELEAHDMNLVAAGQEFDALVAAKKAFDDWAALQPVEPPPPPPEPIFEDEAGASRSAPSSVEDDDGPSWTIHDQARLEALDRQLQDAAVARQQIADRTAASLAALQSIDDLAGFGPPFSDELAELKRLRALVEQQTAAFALADRQADHDHVVAEWVGAGSARLVLPLRCDEVQTRTPALFVHDLHASDSAEFFEFAPLASSGVQQRLASSWAGNEERRLPVPGTLVDLVRSPVRAAEDVLPVHELVIRGDQDGTGSFRAVLEEARVALKAVGELVPDAEALTRVAYDDDFVTQGIADHVALVLPDPVGVDFREVADRAGGLVAPAFGADVISRADGLVDRRTVAGLAGQVPDFAAAFADTRILGFPLADIVDTSVLPPGVKIAETPDGGVSMTWTGLTLKSHDPFRVTPATKLEMTVLRSPSRTETTCRLESFSLVLPPGGTDLVTLGFGALVFTQVPGRPPDLEIEGLEVTLGGDLDLLRTLQDEVDLGDAAPQITTSPTGLKAGYSLAVPEVTAGMFVMRNIAVHVGVEVPFDGRPIVTTLGFARRDSPFTLTVTPFGGSGYLVFEIDQTGIRALEASLDFGGSLAVNVGIASAEVHAFGGARFALRGRDVSCTGFLRIGGSVDVLGLVSVSVELRVDLTYEAGSLSGRATAVIEIDVTFWSGSVTLDSGERTFVGAGPAHDALPRAQDFVPQALPDLAQWRAYRDAFGAA